MKRKLSFLIAAIMVLSLLPAMSVSAKTSNEIVGGVMSVSANYSWAAADPDLIPVLKIQKTDGAETNWSNKQFFLNLSGAKWDFDDYAATIAAKSDSLTWDAATDTLQYNYAAIDAGSTPTVGYNGSLWNSDSTAPSQPSTTSWDMVMLGSDLVDVRFGTHATTPGEALNHNSNTGVVFLPLCVEMTGEGTARVSITDPSGGTGLSFGGSYAFATAYAGATRTTIAGTVTSSKDFTLKQITITETRAGTLDFSKPNGKILLTAPQGFKWVFPNGVADDVMNTVTVRAAAGFTDSTGIAAVPGIVYKYGNDDTTAVIYYQDAAIPGGYGINNSVTDQPNSGTERPGVLLINGLLLTREGTVSETAAIQGDMNVRVSITGGTTETIKVGNFATRSMEMTADDKALPEIVSGVYMRDHFAENTQVLDVTLKELVAGAWNANFDAILTLTDGVKFRGVEIIDEANTQLNKNNDYAFLNSTQGGPQNSGSAYMTLTDTQLTFKPHPNGTTFRTSGPTTDAMMVKMRIYVTVKPGFTGEIKLFTHEDTEGFTTKLEATVAKAINPFEVTAVSNDVQLGYMNINMSDITIKENQAGAMRRTGSSNVDMYHETLGNLAQDPDGYLFSIGGYTAYWNNGGRVPFKAVGGFEPISGDIVIDDVGIHEGRIKVDVKRSSTTPSEFKIVGIKLDADRTIPEGKLELRAGGAAASNWFGGAGVGTPRSFGSFDVENYVVKPDYINIITAAPDKDTKYTTEVEVTIGSTKLIANGVEVQPEMDVAPFIQDGYTMVPVRAVAVALGVSNDQVIWNGATKTVTILDTGRGRQAQFTANSNYITISGGMQVPFEGPSCMVKDGRAFLPFRALGEIVLACPVDWDDETKTAYFNRGGASAQAAAAPAPVEAAE